ncbi:response regulator [Paenibacillus aceris]|uniref:Two-component system response regulator YesN n=1 Tax=Paenibacillus aceris TaxID=869555 RepID=A0ABS4HZ97_9BACL|nr:response regulator [Paenibacillus aceris]MBP1963249.1 two-component system response regulator YesN [Paenibacillus aceris]NHW38638.1 response regulator [Paenibacillus aceris]
MHKVAIIDDEVIITRGLSRNIEWQANGFELVGSAANGEEGMKLVVEKRPHLIITDICMPFVDGFELTEQVVRAYPETKILMLTSYNDFEFAKRALQLKVFDYLLKPVDGEKLLETAKRAIKELEYESEMKQKVVEGMPLLRQQFLEKLFKGKLTPAEINSGIDFLDLQLTAERFVVILLKADDYSYPEYQNRFGKEVLKYCVINVSEETLASMGKGLVFNSIEDEVVLIVFAEGDQKEAELQAYEIAESIRANVEKFLKTTVTAGIGFAYEQTAEITFSYHDARSSLDFRHILGTNRVLTIADTGLSPRKESIVFDGLEKELALKVKLGLEGEAHAILNTIEQSIIESQSFSLSRTRLIGVEITVLMYKELEEQAKQLDDFYSIYNKQQQMQTVHEIFACIRQLVNQLVSIVNHQRENQVKKLINRAVEYMEQHYDQEGLSLHDVSSVIHISPTYLSIIFKKEKNINFSEFLNQLRMNKAMELLRISDLKSYEVAEKVGFKNAHYFSLCFKKYTGVSPSEYKNA